MSKNNFFTTLVLVVASNLVVFQALNGGIQSFLPNSSSGNCGGTIVLNAENATTKTGEPSASRSSMDNAWKDNPLASGWDQAGKDLYFNKRRLLAQTLTSNPSQIYTHHVLPLQPVRTSNPVFSTTFGMTGKRASGWEPETFTNFFQHLTSCRYYVGFGTWLGPTLLYAAQMVEEAHGIEADPVAFAEVQTNVALNRNQPWSKHIYLHSHAIGLGSSTSDLTPFNVEMQSAGAGNSCSGIGIEQTNACGKMSVKWKVNSYPLPALLNSWNIPANTQLFVKVDIESFECALLPSWLPWIVDTLPPHTKPTFHIALHDQVAKCTEQQYLDIYKFANAFDVVGNPKCLDHDKKNWTCGTGEHVFFDVKQ